MNTRKLLITLLFLFIIISCKKDLKQSLENEEKVYRSSNSYEKSYVLGINKISGIIRLYESVKGYPNTLKYGGDMLVNKAELKYCDIIKMQVK